MTTKSNLVNENIQRLKDNQKVQQSENIII